MEGWGLSSVTSERLGDMLLLLVSLVTSYKVHTYDIKSGCICQVRRKWFGNFSVRFFIRWLSRATLSPSLPHKGEGMCRSFRALTQAGDHPSPFIGQG